jgi:hypothetical protein
MRNVFWRYKRSEWVRWGRRYVEMSVSTRNHVYQRWIYIRRGNYISDYVYRTYTGKTFYDDMQDRLKQDKWAGYPF